METIVALFKPALVNPQPVSIVAVLLYMAISDHPTNITLDCCQLRHFAVFRKKILMIKPVVLVSISY